jgi:hypothetical protein
MQKRSTALTFALLAGFVSSAPSSRAADADPKVLEAQVTKLLEAYNKDDVKAFFAGWSKMAEAIATPQVYEAVFKNGAKKMVGDYVAKSIKFRKEGSVLSGDILVVYFEAAFSKEKDCLVTVNMVKEGGAYKFIQVMIGKK